LRLLRAESHTLAYLSAPAIALTNTNIDQKAVKTITPKLISSDE